MNILVLTLFLVFCIQNIIPKLYFQQLSPNIMELTQLPKKWYARANLAYTLGALL